jgi:hypothetical protein
MLLNKRAQIAIPQTEIPNEVLTGTTGSLGIS